MDSITQAVLGASVGEAVLGRRVGYRAAAWGAALGTLPDLDVLADPFVSEMTALMLHRGITHSFAFALAAGPLIGLGLQRLHRDQKGTRRGWIVLSVLVLVTHFLLDSFTSYGTQIFQPFSDYPVIFGTIFIIDPLYTVPLAAGLVLALRRPRASRARRRAVRVGLALSTAYLLLTCLNKAYVEDVFRRALDRQQVHVERLFTSPTPFNNLLWRGLVDTGDGFLVGHYSLLDDTPRVRFEAVPRRDELLAPYAGEQPLEVLRWFSRGYLSAEQRGDTLLVHDLRFGRSDLYMSDSGAHIFTFRLERDGAGRLTGFEQQRPRVEADARVLRRFVDRVLGRASDLVQAAEPSSRHEPVRRR